MKSYRKVFILWISIVYPMKKVEISAKTHLEIDGIEGFIVRQVTKFGNSAKVDCPKEFLGRTVYLVII
jgi:putative transposon-encoded protein